MFERVLLPTDFSEYSVKTIDCVACIPGIRTVTLLHVIDATHPSRHGWTHDPEIEKAKILLAEHKKPLEESGLTVSVQLDVITAGDIASRILQVADHLQVRLIILGARGDSLITELLLGRVVEAVLRRSSASVLVMRHRLIESLEGPRLEKFCPLIYARVLIPTDFSAGSMEAVAVIAQLQGIRETLLLHVVTKGETQEEIERNIEQAKKAMVAAKDRAGSNVRTFVRMGDPVQAINLLAEEEDVSLIVMGAHPKGILWELFHGSTVYDLTTRTKRPVLVVKHPPS